MSDSRLQETCQTKRGISQHTSFRTFASHLLRAIRASHSYSDVENGDEKGNKACVAAWRFGYGSGGAIGIVRNFFQKAALSVFNKVLPSNSMPPASAMTCGLLQPPYPQQSQSADPNAFAHQSPPPPCALHDPYPYPTYHIATHTPYNYAAAPNPDANPEAPVPYSQYRHPPAPSPSVAGLPRNYYHPGVSYPPPSPSHPHPPTHYVNSSNSYANPASNSPSPIPGGYPSSTVPERPSASQYGTQTTSFIYVHCPAS